jgi:hypothetical protein
MQKNKFKIYIIEENEQMKQNAKLLEFPEPDIGALLPSIFSKEGKMIMNQIYVYTLVLPGTIEESTFCNDIYSYLVQALYGD